MLPLGEEGGVLMSSLRETGQCRPRESPTRGKPILILLVD